MWLGYGELRVTGSDGENRSFYVDGGFVQVKGSVVSLLTNRAIPVGQLDAAEAEALLEKSRAIIAKGDAEIAAKLDGLDLGDLNSATPEQLENVEKFVWAYKEVLHDIVRGGHAEVHRRLGEVLSDEMRGYHADLAGWDHLKSGKKRKAMSR